MADDFADSGDDWFILDISHLLPPAPWFWNSLMRCDVGCCGLDAFTFTYEAVRWACGDDFNAIRVHK